MKKQDLKDGMVVQLRNNDLYLVLTGCLINNTNCKSLTIWSDNMLHVVKDDLDIIEVYTRIHPVSLSNIFYNLNLASIWKRKDNSAKVVNLSDRRGK